MLFGHLDGRLYDTEWIVLHLQLGSGPSYFLEHKVMGALSRIIKEQSFPA